MAQKVIPEIRLNRHLTRMAAAVSVGVTCYLAPPTEAQSVTNTIQGPFIGVPVEPLLMTNDLRTLPKIPPWRPGDPVRVIDDLDEDIGPPAGAEPKARKAKSVVRGPLGNGRTTVASTAGPGSVALSFDGNQAVGLLPPDTVGDVGLNHYIQAVNNVFSIYDKQGNLLAGPSAINSLWSGFGGPCESLNSGDPIVQYDHLADRWIISQFTLPSADHQCFAVSRTGDPVTGGWYLYDFATPNANDYPKLSVWPDAYYMSSQRGFPGSGLDVYAFDRARMLVGAPAGFVQFFVAAPSLVLLPSDLDGPPPPAGTPSFFARQVDGDVWGGVDRIDLLAFTVNWATPLASMLSPLPSLATAPFDSVLCSAGLGALCVPQPGTAQKLETLTVWPMWRLQYRNFGDHETLVFNHTVDADGADHAGIRWYELRRPPFGAWSIFQQGTQAPDEGAAGLADDVHRWMGRIAMDGAGNIALAYSASSDSVYPGLRYTGRLAADPPGVMTLPEVTIIAGAGSQTHFSGRWGDYSTMSIDPVDGCKFWFTSEYYGSTSVAGWLTRIAAFSLETQPPTINCPANLVQATAPGQCSAVVNFVVPARDNCSAATVACVPPSGSVFPNGTTSVTCTATDASGNRAECRFDVIVLDKESPKVYCMPGPNPSGKKVPSAGKNSRSGQNPDGFYKVLAQDNCDPKPKIYVKDSASSFVAGPFASGSNLKIVQAPGARPRQQPGPGVIAAHVTLRGDALLYAVDAERNVSDAISCKVPPPPK